MGEFFGVLLPAGFGDFAREYRAARETVALADLNFLSVLSLGGADRHRYLNAILTSNVRDLQPGQGAIGLLLNPQGHILAEVETYATPDRILAACHGQVRERTAATLEKFIIMDDVTLEDWSGSYGILALAGPRSTGVVASLCGVDIGGWLPLAHAEAAVGAIPCRAIRRDICGVTGAAFIAERAHLPALWQELARAVRGAGGTPAGMDALNSLRLEAGVAWFGYDFDDKRIPHEAGLEHSHISYEKGCYTGQEIVERVRSRGNVHRRLVGLQFFADTPPAPGTTLTAAGNEAGHVTSAALSPRLGRPVGLAYMRSEYLAAGTRLDAAGIVAEPIGLPLTGVAAG